MRFNKLIPELRVLNIEKSLGFYRDILGFRVEYERSENKFAFISYMGAQMMLEQNTNPHWKTGKLKYPYGRGVNFQIEVRNLNDLLVRLNKNGYPLKLKAKENWYRKEDKLLGLKEFLVLDPDGYLLRFSQRIGEKKA